MRINSKKTQENLQSCFFNQVYTSIEFSKFVMTTAAIGDNFNTIQSHTYIWAMVYRLLKVRLRTLIIYYHIIFTYLA